MFSRKTNKNIQQTFCYNNPIVKFTHKHNEFQLQRKQSFSKHTNKKINKAAIDIWLLRQLQPILPGKILLIIYKSFIRHR